MLLPVGTGFGVIGGCTIDSGLGRLGQPGVLLVGLQSIWQACMTFRAAISSPFLLPLCPRPPRFCSCVAAVSHRSSQQTQLVGQVFQAFPISLSPLSNTLSRTGNGKYYYITHKRGVRDRRSHPCPYRESIKPKVNLAKSLTSPRQPAQASPDPIATTCLRLRRGRQPGEALPSLPGNSPTAARGYRQGPALEPARP